MAKGLTASGIIAFFGISACAAVVESNDDGDRGASSASVSSKLTADEWLDYLIQDTCRVNGVAVSGDPRTCGEHSNLQPGELVHSKFRYLTGSNHTVVQHSLPRNSPHGVSGFVVFDWGQGTGGMGTFDFEDPHCVVPNTLCFDGQRAVDIVDLVESKWDNPWYNVVSISGTAHGGTGGYLGWTTATLGSSASSWPDGWLLGVSADNIGTTSLGLTVYRDALGDTVDYTSSYVWNKALCQAGLGAMPSTCSSIQDNQWLKVGHMYMGEGKTFDDLMVSMHSGTYDAMNSCASHLELYVHSKEYGIISHQIWKKVGCAVLGAGWPNEPEPGCQTDSASGMVVSPMTYYADGAPLVLERYTCGANVADGPEYVFDPRSLSQPSTPQPYPTAAVVDDVGYGNLLMNGQFAWSDKALAGWGRINVSASEVETGAAAVAKYNDAASVSCGTLDCSGSSIFQDIDLSVRSPGVPGHSVDYGARVSRSGTLDGNGDVYLWQYRADGASNGVDHVSFVTDSAWPDPGGQFVSSTAFIKSDTRSVRYQVYVWSSAAEYVLDDAYLTRSF